MIRDDGFDGAFTLQLLDCFPDLRLPADVSHYMRRSRIPAWRPILTMSVYDRRPK